MKQERENHNMSAMKLSLITVSYNSVSTIRDTFLSVRTQVCNCFELEYIVIDGASTDGTQDIVKENEDIVSVYISENDGGIYDAMNKGLRCASGEVVAFLNSDDYFSDDRVLETVMRVFLSNDRCSVVYGNLDYVDQKGQVRRRWRTGKQRPFRSGWHPAHPAFYARKNLFDELGNFDLSFKIGADFDLMMRFLENPMSEAHYLNRVLVKMRLGGVSNNSLKSRLILKSEYEKSFRKQNITPRRGYIYLRWLSKLFQYVR